MRHSWVFIPFVFLLFSCAGKLPPFTAEHPDLSAILAKAKRTQMGFTSIKARARVSIKSPQGKIVFDQVATVVRPEFLRVSVFAPFGEMLARVVSDGESVRMKTNWEELIFENPEDFRLSYLYPGLPPQLGVEDIVNFLLGGSPFAIPQESYSVRTGEKEGEIVFVFSGSTPLQVTVDFPRNFITRVEGTLSDGEKAKIEFSLLKRIDSDTYFPRNLLFETADYSLNVNYDENLRVNSKTDISFFQSAEEP
ncbi:MAG: hypothetical protein OXK19_05790 [Candidatus Dadabacteria bacterium]|nr:hypothetical protein [Candidatus Dadabacteria bacterium]